MLTAAQQKVILTKIEECYVKCETHYKRTFKRPTTRFDLRGTTAGTANPSTHVLRFQAGLAAKHWEDFLGDTVPHEVAHLIDYDVNNKLEEQQMQRSYALETAMMFGRRRRRVKRDIHGDSWRAVMRVLGINHAARCHSYDTTGVARRKSRHEYKCVCGATLSVGPKHHNAIQRGARLTHKVCRGVITAAMLVKSAPPQRFPLAAQVPAPTPPREPKPARMGTKLDQAINIVSNNNYVDAGSYIAIIMRDTGMSKAGATTYYYQAKKKLGR